MGFCKAVGFSTQEAAAEAGEKQTGLSVHESAEVADGQCLKPSVFQVKC